MKLNREELLKTLTLAKPALAKKEFILQATHFIFQGDYIATYNDSICIIAPFKTNFKCSVNGDEFYKALESISEEIVDISLTDNQILIKSKKTKAGLSTLVDDQEKVDNLIEDLKNRTSEKKFWKKLPGDFINGIFLCMFNASKDMTTGVRCCVAVRGNEIYSTDNLRISKYTLSSKMDEMLIPARDAVELSKYEVTRYGKSDNWLHFITDDEVMFSCRTMIGDYPFDSLSRFFKKEPNNVMTLPKDLQDVMKAAAVFAAGDVDVAKMVEIKIEGNTIHCKSEKERGWMEKEIDIEEKFEKEILFYINPMFFAQVLDKATSLFLIVGEEYPDKAVFLNENFVHMIALPA